MNGYCPRCKTVMKGVYNPDGQNYGCAFCGTGFIIRGNTKKEAIG